MTEKRNAMKDIERFEIKYEGKSCRISLDGDPLFSVKNKDDEHLKLRGKRGKLWSMLKEVGKEELFYPELVKDIITSIEVNFVKTKNKKVEGKQEIIKADTSIKKWKDLKKVIKENLFKREEEFKFVIACVISRWFTDNDFIFVLLIARRGEGKSTLLNPFDGSPLVLSIDQCTTNAFAPGTAEYGEEKASLLEEVKDKTLIIHDMTALLSLGKDQRVKIFGEITNSYGKQGLIKFSPGAGSKRYGGGYNLIGGITYDVFQPNKRLLMQTGRFLYYKLPELSFMQLAMSKKVPNQEKLQKAIQGYLFNLEIRFKKEKPVIKIPDEVYLEMRQFFNIYEHYLKVYSHKVTDPDTFKTSYKLKYKNEYHVENPNRRYRQAIMLLKAMAFLEGKDTVCQEDFNSIKILFQGIDDPKTIHKKLSLIPDGVLHASVDKYEVFETEKVEKDIIPDQEEPELEYDYPEEFTTDINDEMLKKFEEKIRSDKK